MSQPATIAILRGPDEGRTFLMEEDQLHIGLDGENQIVLSDTTLEDHQASIVRRNGRFAIFTPVVDGVEVDGNRIPPEQWVWLPAEARLRFGTTTLAQFRDPSASSNEASGEVPAETPDAPPPQRKKQRPQRKKKPAGKPASGKSRKVARFITDQAGDQLVRLGDDGKLPQLALTEANQAKSAKQEKRESSPVLLYVAVGLSLLMSLGMLFFDPDSFSSSARTKEEARKKITQFYGKEGELKPYQKLLREARRSHSVGDLTSERRAYKKVLVLLNAEDSLQSITGLTGDKRSDEELRDLIGQLMTR